MSIVFEPSACKHFAEDNIDEALLRASMAHPLWIARVRTDATGAPNMGTGCVALIICLRHEGAWQDDLVEILARPVGRDMHIFHVQHLTDKWYRYWKRWSR